jgi:chemotaxis signal transduction protein
VITQVAGDVRSGPTGADIAREGDELVVVRAGTWRMLVPLRHVRRIHAAVLPTARPGAPALAPVVSVGGTLIPVAFAAALAGESRVELATHHQMVELSAGPRLGLLWVDSAEDVVPFAPAAVERPAEGLVAAWSNAAAPLPVLDVPRLLELLSMN